MRIRYRRQRQRAVGECHSVCSKGRAKGAPHIGVYSERKPVAHSIH